MGGVQSGHVFASAPNLDRILSYPQGNEFLPPTLLSKLGKVISLHLAPGPQQRWRGSAKARGRAFTRAESGGKLLARGVIIRVSALEWRGVGDKSAKKRGAHLLSKGEQLLYSGWVKVLSRAYSRLMSWEKLRGGRKVIPIET